MIKGITKAARLVTAFNRIIIKKPQFHFQGFDKAKYLFVIRSDLYFPEDPVFCSKKHKVNQDEESSAVLSHHVRKTPDVSDADGTAGGKHDEAEAASEIFTLFNIFSPQISLM